MFHGTIEYVEYASIPNKRSFTVAKTGDVLRVSNVGHTESGHLVREASALEMFSAFISSMEIALRAYSRKYHPEFHL